MRRWLGGSMVALVALAIVSLAPMPGAAQTSAATTYTPPRTSDGQPDLQGIWQVLNTAAWDIQDHGARLGVPAGKGVVEGNEIPYQPSALAKKQENFKNRERLDPETQCHLPGVPRVTYMPYPFRIVQQANRITILHEYVRANDQTWFDRAGNFHSDALHLVERLTPTGPDHLLYEVTIEDPKVFTRPWKMSMPLYRRQEKDIELLEYDCGAYLLEQEWDKPGSTFFGQP